MIIEPTPTNPRSPVRRALRLAGLVLPALLLTGVVTAGLLGPRAEAQPPVETTPTLSAAPAKPAPSPNASGGPRPLDAAGGPDAPATVADLPVRSVSATLAARGKPDVSPIVAVAGYLRFGAGEMCRLQLGLPGSACARPVVIAETAGGTPGSGSFGGIGAHIHAMVPPGVLLPGDQDGPASEPGVAYPFVVVIGRFGASDAGCAADMRGCRDPFAVESVVWVDGETVAVTPGAQASLRASSSDPVVSDTQRFTQAALGPTSVLLRVLLLGSGLEAVDPVAAEAIAGWRASHAGGAVWYLRILDVPQIPRHGPFKGPRMPQIRWAVVAQRSGVPIATGWVRLRTTDATAGGG